MNARRVVVVGHGMAGARLAGEIRRLDPGGDQVDLTVLGEEAHPAYNRVLLSSVLAGGVGFDGVVLHDSDWGQRNGVDLRLGAAVRAIDRERRRVVLGAGETVGYDALVLATGSRPRVPSVTGLTRQDGELAPGVVAFRTVDDCRRILASAEAGAPIAVLGGGLLGLEAARGLAARGAPVTVVHQAGHLMDRQLDPMAGATLAESLREADITFRLGRTALGYRPGAGLDLDDGTTLPAGLVVVATGVRADTDLAERAGLRVRRGVAVDDQLRSTDPAIYAIGDCAEHPGTIAGLVDSAFEQATVLADLLTSAGSGARYSGTPTVTRLKARGVELTALGESLVPVDSPDAEVVCLSQPRQGRYGKLVLRDGRVSGAILLGLPDAAANVVQYFDSGLPAPADRLALLLGRAMPTEAPPRPADMPDNTVVCRCNSVTKGRLVNAWRPGRGDNGLIAETRATTGCGTCRDVVRDLTAWLAEQHGVTEVHDRVR